MPTHTTAAAELKRKFEERQLRRQKLLAAAAFGVHFEVVQDITTLFERELHHSAFFFYDYFLDRPITWFADEANELHQEQRTTAPFLARIARSSKFVPLVDKNIVRKLQDDVAKEYNKTKLAKFPGLRFVSHNLDSANQQKVPLYTLRAPLEKAEVLTYLYKLWRGHMNGDSGIIITKPDYLKHSKRPLKIDPAFGDNGIVSISDELELNKFKDDYPCSLLIKDGKRVAWDEAVTKLREYGLVLYPWLDSSSPVKVISVSISSRSIFWGECILLFSGTDLNDFFLKKLTELLSKHVMNTYVPMLCLFENYLCEKDIQEKLKDLDDKSNFKLDDLFSEIQFSGIAGRQPTIDWLTHGNNKALLQIFARGNYSVDELKKALPAYSIKSLDKRPKTAKYDNVFLSLLSDLLGKNTPEDVLTALKRFDVLERGLAEIWADRLVRLIDCDSKPVLDAKPVRESLVFAKYMIASPSMIKLVTEAARIRHQKQERTKPSDTDGKVKTTLVVGGPGSGKDSMAELVTLFSPGFRLGRMEKMNMAMFRPKEAAVPLLLGLEVKLRQLDEKKLILLDDRMVSLDGLLSRAIASSSNQGPGVTFVFDELNSLDIDTQGALLRFIENGELKPLGGLTRTADGFDVLIVGVMNEDPQVITKRRAMESVLRDRTIFGGMVGEFLYETFRTQRRLRDDLYYRFIRGGELLLPELRDRREDIPVLFYNAIDNLKELIPDSAQLNWDIDLSAYEKLMDPALRWEGNLRELQTIARRTLSFASEDYDRRRRMASGHRVIAYRIMGSHVHSAVKAVSSGGQIESI